LSWAGFWQDASAEAISIAFEKQGIPNRLQNRKQIRHAASRALAQSSVEVNLHIYSSAELLRSDVKSSLQVRGFNVW
jgi:hypothetical protein